MTDRRNDPLISLLSGKYPQIQRKAALDRLVRQPSHVLIAEYFFVLSNTEFRAINYDDCILIIEP